MFRNRTFLRAVGSSEKNTSQRKLLKMRYRKTAGRGPHVAACQLRDRGDRGWDSDRTRRYGLWTRTSCTGESSLAIRKERVTALGPLDRAMGAALASSFAAFGERRTC
jgi:hypothetical protein